MLTLAIGNQTLEKFDLNAKEEMDTYLNIINVGDDIGFENLKKVKMSCRPHMLIPKYAIYFKKNDK